MKTKIPFILLFLITHKALHAQQNLFHYDVHAIAGYTTEHVPFWMRANQFGSIPPAGASLGLVGNVHKDYNPVHRSVFDWGAGLEFRGDLASESDIRLIEAYAKIRISIFEIKGGRSKEIMGLCDTLLTTGPFAEAGNALGIPKVQISIPQFYTIPFLGRLFAFKGNYAHGWIGSTTVNMLHNAPDRNLETYIHQKSLYGRFGKPEWKLKLYGGFSHQVFWGSENIYFGSAHVLSPFETYMYIVMGKPYGTSLIPKSKIGNQLGSIDAGFDYQFKNVKLFVYHQFFYDIGALYHMANLRDGLSGLSLTHTTQKSQAFGWKKILFEFFYSKNQAGELWSPYTPSGDENYYNNDQYIKGWSYNSLGIGNPLIGTRHDIRSDLPADPRDYFINNRVIAFHGAFMGHINEWNLVVKGTFSLNYGTYGTDEVGHTLGKIRTLPRYGLFGEQKQFSAMVETGREIKERFNVKLAAAFDVGQLLYNTAGVMLTAGFKL